MSATVPALRGVSFSVAPGEIVALVGANGAGKFTLLRVLTTLLLPTRGRAWIGGVDVMREPAQARQKLGYSGSTDGSFYARLSARENLRLFATLNNIGRAQADRRISVLADLLNLSAVMDLQVRTCSTGTVHRLSLARALLHEPSVLVLGEPMGVWIHSRRPNSGASCATTSSSATAPRCCLPRTRSLKSSNWPDAWPYCTPAGCWPSTHRSGCGKQPGHTLSSNRWASWYAAPAPRHEGAQRIAEIVALFLRDLSIARSYRAMFVLQFFEILFGVASFYYLSRFIETPDLRRTLPQGGTYFAFVLVGIAFFDYLSVALSAFDESLGEARQNGTLEYLLVTQTTLPVILVGSVVYPFVVLSLRTAAYLAWGITVFGFPAGQANWAGAAMVLAASVLAFIGLVRQLHVYSSEETL